MDTNKDIESSSNVRELVKEKSVTMEYFLESSHLDAATAEMLKKYDRDGNGSFSKDEVVAIILDLREAMQSNEMLGASNKFFKRMLIGVSIFSLLMLTSIFGLTYAVAALTAKLDVNSNGVMTSADGKTIVATNANSIKVIPVKDENSGAFCISSTERDNLIAQATSGKTNVLMEFAGFNETHTRTQQLNGGAMDTDGETTCFFNAQGQQVCMEPSDECSGVSGGRRLAGSICDTPYTVAGKHAYTNWFYDNLPTTITNCIDNYCQFDADWDLTASGAACACSCGNFIKVSP